MEDNSGNPDTAVLTLSHFSRPLFLSFGTVGIRTSCTHRFAMENPNTEPILVAVWRSLPTSKGFMVEQLSQTSDVSVPEARTSLMVSTFQYCHQE
uniref:Uncharacterized protein n=1 Tax=Sphaerodactylus townsendi TaxID=933632 RepID=A0ACB8ERA4_9SAUR